MNSAFIQNLAAEAAKSAAAATGEAEQVGLLYRRILAARSDARRNKERARISAERHPAALCASPALDQRGDLSAMNLKLTRREMIETLGGGMGLVGLAGAVRGPVEERGPRGGSWKLRRAGTAGQGQARHLDLFLNGGPSQLDMFDPKPALFKYAGQRPNAVDLRTERVTGGLLPSPFEFKRYGRNGVEVSELLPQIASVIDDICVIRSMYTFNPTHTPARALFHSGSILATRPSMGSWISYGLGSENENLPSFVALGSNGSGPQTRSGFLPTEHQGVGFQRGRSRPREDHSESPQHTSGCGRAANRHGRAPPAQSEPLEIVRRRRFPRWAHQVDGDGLSHAVRGAESVRHPQRAGSDPRQSTATRLSERLPAGAPAGRSRRAVRQRLLSGRTDLGRSSRRERQSPQALPGYGSRGWPH